MTHSVIAETTSRLHALRLASFTVRPEESAHVSPNVYFCWDKSTGEVELNVTSQPGQLLSLEAKVHKMPAWFTLNFGLGAGRWQAGDALGLVLAGSSDKPISLFPFVRSVVGQERHDTHLAEPIKLDQAPCHCVLIHTIQTHEPLASAQNFHTLVIPLPKQNFRLELKDMRLVHTAGTRTPRPAAGTIASLAV